VQLDTGVEQGYELQASTAPDFSGTVRSSVTTDERLRA